VRRAQLCGAGAIYLMCSCSKLFSDRILGAQFVYEKLLVFYLKCAACLFVSACDCKSYISQSQAETDSI
jgi:hypothetical protein